MRRIFLSAPLQISLIAHLLIFKGLTIKGIYGREMFETWYKMASMLQSGLDITKIITHHFPVAEFEKAFEVMRGEQSGKVILDWQSV